MTDSEKILEKVGLYIDGYTFYGTASERQKQLTELLTRKLLPLIEAGQAYHDWAETVTRYDDNVPYVNGTYDGFIDLIQRNYRNAKAKCLRK